MSGSGEPVQPPAGLLALADRLFTWLENARVPVAYYPLTAVGVINLRTVVEQFTGSVPNRAFDSLAYVHFLLFYLTLSISLILVYHAVTGVDILKVTRVLMVSVVILMLPPILDYALSLGRGYDISYLLPGIHDDLLARYLTFFGNMSVIIPGEVPIRKELGITPGIRIETMLVLLESALYFRLRGCRPARIALGVWLVYTVAFCFALPPFFIQWSLAALGLPYAFTQRLLAGFFLLWAAVVIPPYLALAAGPQFRFLASRVGYALPCHYLLMFCFGVAAGARARTGGLDGDAYLSLYLALAGTVCAYAFGLAIEALGDAEAGERAAPPGLGAVAIWLAGITLLYAAVAGDAILIFLGLCLSNHFLYAMYPLRLKRLPVLGKLPLAFNSLFLLAAGFTLAADPARRLPASLIALVLVGGTLAFNAIDLDKEHDGLVALWGRVRARLAVGAAVLLTYAAAGLIIGRLSMALALYFLGVLQFFLINRSPYRRGLVFLIYTGTLMLITFHMYSGTLAAGR